MRRFRAGNKFQLMTDEDDQDEINVKARTHLKHSLLRYWVWEFASLFLAGASILAICFVLTFYNGRPLPEWPYGLSINTLLSVLSTVLRACLIAVLTSIIGQAKWQWLCNGPRPIDDLQMFDQATRGLVGSFPVIKILAQRFLESIIPLLSVIVVILSVAIGPFVQQAVRTVICDKPGNFGEASLPVVQILPGNDGYFRTGAGMYEPGKGLQGILLNALTKSGRGNVKLQFECTTGNCTFPAEKGVIHSTLAMCSKCFDLSAKLIHQEYPNGTDTFRLGDVEVSRRPGLQGTKLAVGTIYNIPLPSELLQVSVSSVANISILSLAPDSFTNKTAVPHAAICSLYFCKQDFEAVVEQSQLTEKLVSTTLLPIVVQEEPLYHYRLLAKSPCLVDGDIYTPANFSSLRGKTPDRTFKKLEIDNQIVDVPSDCIYSVNPWYATSITQWLQKTLFNGHCEELASASAHVVECGNKFWLANFFDKDNTTLAYHEQLLRELAASVTVFLRMDAPKKLIEGIAEQKTACLELQWAWLLYSVILCFLTGTLLLATLISAYRQNGNMPIWKSSLLPLLCLDIQPDKQASHQRVLNTEKRDLYELGTMAKYTNISFGNDADNIELLSKPKITHDADEVHAGSAFTGITLHSPDDTGSRRAPSLPSFSTSNFQVDF
ncbi:hypothetical protein PWT90_10014 [Aphanocladium album]|nr:hypothetical protein PWT90_10014 [Aphanocladium album]